jgi:HEAT repeat protein
MNRYLWLAVLCGVIVIAAIAAIWLVDVSEPRLQAELNLTVQIVAAVGTLGSVVLAVIGLRDGGLETEQPLLPSPSAAGLGGPAEVLDEAESLTSYVSQMRANLEDLAKRAEQLGFVPLTTEADVAKNQDSRSALRPRLEWLPRQHQEQYLTARPEQVDLFALREKRFARCVLLGDPGSGKSTLLREFASRELDRIAAAGTDRVSEIGPLPLYVPLSDWADRNPKVKAVDFLQHYLTSLLGETNYFSHRFKDLLANGRFLLLLDGLNELPARRASTREGRHERVGDDNRVEMMRAGGAALGSIDPRERALREFAERIGLQCRIVLSCRSHEYFDSLQWTVIRIVPMTPDQVDQFLDAYLTPEMAAELRTTMRRNPTLAAIATNPFFLHTVITSPSPRLANLTSRGELLGYLYEELLERERNRPVLAGHSEPDLTRAIGRIAFKMIRRGSVGTQVPLPRVGTKEKALAEALTATGLIVAREDHLFFHHQIIQEFFAAAALRRRFVHRRPATLLADKRWTEVVALWLDLDRKKVRPLLLRGLRAWNLPWRRPRSRPGVPLMVYNGAANLAVYLLAVAYVMDWLLWPMHVLASPAGWAPLGVIALVIVAQALRIPISFITRHRPVIVNSAYVLAVSRQPDAIPEMVAAFGRVWQAERAEIATSLGRFGTQATSHAIEGLKSPSWRVRDGCVRTLGEIARQGDATDAEVVQTLLAVGTADDPQLAGPVIEALRHCQDSRVPEALANVIEQVERWSPLVASMRLEPLSRWTQRPEVAWSSETVNRLYELIDPNQPALGRLVAVQAIGKLQLPGSAERLAALAADVREPENLRTAAVSALGLLQSQEALGRLVAVAEQTFELEAPAAAAIRSIRNRSAIPALQAAAGSQERGVREATAAALGQIGGDEVLPILQRLAADDDPAVRAEAAGALGASNLPGGLAELTTLVRDPFGRVRTAAIDALIDGFPDHAAPILQRLAADSSYQERARAIGQLAGYNDPEVRATLHALTGDTDRTVREEAQTALEQLEGTGTRRARSRASWRTPIKAVKLRVREVLQLEGLRELVREERLNGTPDAQVYLTVQKRILNDAELARRYRAAYRMYMLAGSIAYLLFGAILILLLRLAVWASGGIIGLWRPFAVVLLIAGLSMLPGVRGARHVRVIGTLILICWAAAVTVLGILAVGAVVYTWWIWVLLASLTLAGLVAVDLRRRRRRRDQVISAVWPSQSPSVA